MSKSLEKGIEEILKEMLTQENMGIDPVLLPECYSKKIARLCDDTHNSSWYDITFEELIEHGRQNCGKCIGADGMPWSFDFHGYPVTHENDTCYIINTKNGPIKFQYGDLLIVEKSVGFSLINNQE
jgi:hypothetical protein